MGQENYDEFREATRKPDVVRAVLEDYRAGLTIDQRHEQADLARPSNRWRRANARLREEHRRVADPRFDAIHKMTTSVARTYATVVIEDLFVPGWSRTGAWPGTSWTRRLHRSLASSLTRSGGMAGP